MTLGTYSDKELEEYFFFEVDTERDFYDSDTPAPSKDIWKKFELIPTPPRSPSRDSGSSGQLSPAVEDRLQMVSEYINEKDPFCQTSCTDLLNDIFSEDFSADVLDSLSSNFEAAESCSRNSITDSTCSNAILIADCMWSPKTEGCTTVTNNSTGGGSSSTRTRQDSSCDSTCVGCVSTPTDSESVCVDPTAVFPYPSVVDTCRSNTAVMVGGNSQTPRPGHRSGGANSSNMLNMTREHSYSLGTETPAQSDSEEEIDVVTVDKFTVCTKQRKSHSADQPHTTVVTVQPQSKHLMLNKTTGHSPLSMSLKRTHRSISTPNSPQSHPTKKLRREASVPELKLSKHRSHHLHRSQASSSDIDSEDSDGKRTQHNVLERKRRNDLKYSFLTLRDSVPELQAQERAPKVTILKMAAEHIRSLTWKEQTLTSELEHQKSRREQLQRRLSALRRNCCI